MTHPSYSFPPSLFTLRAVFFLPAEIPLEPTSPVHPRSLTGGFPSPLCVLRRCSLASQPEKPPVSIAKSSVGEPVLGEDPGLCVSQPFPCKSSMAEHCFFPVLARFVPRTLCVRRLRVRFALFSFSVPRTTLSDSVNRF